VLRPAWPVAAILAAAVLAVLLSPPLPPSLAGMRTLGPYVLLVAAAGVSLWFNRERAFVLAASLLAGFTANDYLPDALTYAAFATLVPLNVLLSLALPERGLRFGRVWRWVALLFFELFLFYVLDQNLDVQEAMDHWLVRSPPTPFIGRLAFAAAFAAAVARSWPNHTPLETGVAGALAAFFIACEWIEEPRIFATFVTAATMILVVAVLQESHRMAFRDALTGLPNRRALEEQLRALEAPYTAAMIDIDHFKTFNDTWGHQTGDQVLRLVANCLSENVKGRDTAARYGGEEFVVILPQTALTDAVNLANQIRTKVESKKLVKKSTGDILGVITISAGVTQYDANESAVDFLRRADVCLYAAKRSGRNRVVSEADEDGLQSASGNAAA